MRILMIASSYPRYAGDGAGAYVQNLSRGLAARGHEVAVVAPWDEAVADAPNPWADGPGVLIYRFRYAPTAALHLAGHGRALQADVRLKWIMPLLMPGFVAAALLAALRLHRRRPYDIVHGHWAVPGGAIAALAARLIGRPLVITLHGSDVFVAERSQLYGAAARWALRQAAHVDGVCDDLRARAVRLGLAKAKSGVIPCAVDLTPQPPLHDMQREGALIGALGRLVYKKGLQHLIGALPMVLREFPEARCVIGGEGDLRDALAAQAQRLGLAERVSLPGHIPHTETPAFFAACDVVGVPSVVDAAGNVDGLPHTLLEAMAAGCAVVGSRVAGIAEVVEDGVTGLLVPPADEAALADALIRLLRDPTLRQRLGAAARQVIAERYSIARLAERQEAVYIAASAQHTRTRAAAGAPH